LKKPVSPSPKKVKLGEATLPTWLVKILPPENRTASVPPFFIPISVEKELNIPVVEATVPNLILAVALTACGKVKPFTSKIEATEPLVAIATTPLESLYKPVSVSKANDTEGVPTEPSGRYDTEVKSFLTH